MEVRQPPHSLEAEQSVLGALLLDNTAFERVSWLTDGAFYADRNRRVWQVVAKMIEGGRRADALTVTSELGQDLEKAGGAVYLQALAQNMPSAANVEHYAELVRRKAVQRELAIAGTSIAEEALTHAGAEIGHLLDTAESRILQISERTARRGQGPEDLKPLLAKVLERIDTLYHRADQSGITGVPSGYHDLDAKTAGFQPGDLIIVAGRPSMGKTALALNMAEHVALECRLPVLIFSMEMSATQLTQRLLGSVAKLDQHKLRTGRLSDEEWRALTEGMAKLHDAPLQIDESAALTALELRARARREWRKAGGKLGLVVVDYLQLMDSPSKGEHRATEIAEISRSLKAMAKELNCPVIALSQLNRSLEARIDRRPVMSDLRESGAIEQDADVILFIYRQAVYTPDMPEDEKNVAELIIGKQRNGPIGTVPLVFMGHFTRFENYANPAGGWKPYRPARGAKVQNFHDYKSAAAGEKAT